MSIQQVLDVVQPEMAAFEIPDQEWQHIEANIGIILPYDYKEYIRYFGTGSFADFLYIYNPFDEEMNLVQAIQQELNVYQSCKRTTPQYCGFPIYTESAGLLPWGRTDNGDSLHWLTQGHPDKWAVIVYDSKYIQHQRYEMSMTTFIARWLLREIDVPFFPKDIFPVEVPIFQTL